MKKFNQFNNKLKNMDSGLLVIIIYGFYQGLQTIYNISKRLTYIKLEATDATNNLLFLTLGTTVIIGAVGLYRYKPWGCKISLATYGCIIPLIIYTAIKMNNATLASYTSCAIDIIYAGGVLYYLSIHRIKEKFQTRLITLPKEK